MKKKHFTPLNSKQESPQYQPKWHHFLLKTILSILLPYLLSPPDISIYIYHITIALPS